MQFFYWSRTPALPSRLHEPDIVAGHHGVFAVLRVILQRVVQAVVRATTFFTGQRRSGDQQSGLNNIDCLVRAAISRLRRCDCMARNAGTTCCSAFPSRTTPTCCHISDCTFLMNFSVSAIAHGCRLPRSPPHHVCWRSAAVRACFARPARHIPALRAASCWPAGSRRALRYKPPRRRRKVRGATSARTDRYAHRPWRNAPRANGHQLGGDINVVLHAGGVNHRKAFAHPLGIEMGEVEIDCGVGPPHQFQFMAMARATTSRGASSADS